MFFTYTNTEYFGAYLDHTRAILTVRVNSDTHAYMKRFEHIPGALYVAFNTIRNANV